MRDLVRPMHWLLALLCSVALLACGTVAQGEYEKLDEIQSQLLGDLRLPPGAKIDNSRSLVIGGGANWAGRVVIQLEQGPSAAFAHFRDQYQGSGWTNVASIKARTSILVFTRQERTVTLEIAEAGALSGGSQLTMTAMPKGITGPSSQASASAAATTGAVAYPVTGGGKR